MDPLKPHTLNRELQAAVLGIYVANFIKKESTLPKMQTFLVWQQQRQTMDTKVTQWKAKPKCYQFPKPLKQLPYISGVTVMETLLTMMMLQEEYPSQIHRYLLLVLRSIFVYENA